MRASPPPGFLISGQSPKAVRVAGAAALRILARAGLRAAGRFEYAGGAAAFRAALGEQTELGGVPAIGAALDDSGVSAASEAAEAILHAAEGPALTGLGSRPRPLPLARMGSPAEAPLAFAGALARLLGVERRALGDAQDALKAGYEYAAANFPDCGFAPSAGTKDLFAASGPEAAAWAALDAGCRFFAAAGEFGALGPSLKAAARGLAAAVAETGDGAWSARLAAGAGYAGARAAAEVLESDAPSASETARWAAAAEVPVVFLHVGAADRTFSAVTAADGQTAPRAALAPTSFADIPRATREAFELADRFQCPVSVLLDDCLTRRWEADELPSAAGVDRGLWGAGPPPRGEAAAGGFDRYADSESGVSPRAAPGQPGLFFCAVEPGVGDAARRLKLARKHDALKAALAADEPPEEAVWTVAVWGGNCVPVGRAVETLNSSGGPKVRLLEVRNLFPFVGLPAGCSEHFLAVESGTGEPLRRWLRAASGVEAISLRLSAPDDPESTLAQLREALT